MACRYAQELLLQKDISLVLNVKHELLDRVARCTGALVRVQAEATDGGCCLSQLHADVRLAVSQRRRQEQHPHGCLPSRRWRPQSTS